MAHTSAWSSASSTVKDDGRPTSGPWRDRIRRQTAWNVPAVTAERSTPVSAPARDTISLAARRVNVTSMTASGDVPRSMAWARVATIVRVLPDPADARISVRPAAPSTAASCSSSSMARSASEAPPSRRSGGRSRYTFRLPGSAASGSRPWSRSRAAFWASTCGRVGGAVRQRG
jgi:hypothetical protein